MTNIVRRSLILAGLAVLAVAAVAWAHGPGYGNGYGRGYHMMGNGYGYHMGNGWGPQAQLDQLAPEQREAFQALADEHRDRMIALHDEALVLRNQLATAPDAETVAQIRQQLTDAANRLDEERATFQARIQEQFGITAPAYGYGYGHGYGHGFAACPGYGNW